MIVNLPLLFIGYRRTLVLVAINLRIIMLKKLQSNVHSSNKYHIAILSHCSKRFANDESIKIIKNQGLIKGKTYFERYYYKSSRPWFVEHTLTRDLIVTICCCRSNHHSLKESLLKIKVVNKDMCECEMGVQDLNHVIWQCRLFDVQRKSSVVWLKLKNILLLI